MILNRFIGCRYTARSTYPYYLLTRVRKNELKSYQCQNCISVLSTWTVLASGLGCFGRRRASNATNSTNSSICTYLLVLICILKDVFIGALRYRSKCIGQSAHKNATAQHQFTNITNIKFVSRILK